LFLVNNGGGKKLPAPKKKKYKLRTGNKKSSVSREGKQ